MVADAALASRLVEYARLARVSHKLLSLGMVLALETQVVELEYEVRMALVHRVEHAAAGCPAGGRVDLQARSHVGDVHTVDMVATERRAHPKRGALVVVVALIAEI
jgi:hypothetical protein